MPTDRERIDFKLAEEAGVTTHDKLMQRQAFCRLVGHGRQISGKYRQGHIKMCAYCGSITEFKEHGQDRKPAFGIITVWEWVLKDVWDDEPHPLDK